MNRIATLGLALALTAVAAGPAAAFDLNSVATFATELAPVDSCSYGEAVTTMRRAGYKSVAELPVSGNAYRFIVAVPHGYAGLRVDGVDCGMTLVSDIGMKRPWCEYFPARADRCPTMFLAR